MPVAQIEGGDIHYEEGGVGAVLAMLLPESGGPVGVRPFHDRLAETLPGGPLRPARHRPKRTRGRARGMTMAGRAAEPCGAFRRAGIDRAHLFCHSTGCGIGLSLSAACPDRVAGLVLANPWSHGDAHLTAMQRLRVAAARALDPYCYAWFTPACCSRRLPPRARRGIREAGQERGAAGCRPDRGQAGGDPGFRTLAAGAGPDLPYLVATAADDQLMPSWFGAELAALIPVRPTARWTAAATCCRETRGDALANAVTDFLDTVA